MRLAGLALALAASLATCDRDRSAGAREPIVGGPCEGCEAVFEGQPPVLRPQAALAGPDEPGPRLTVTGTVRDRGGRPVAGTIVYAYQTDAAGIYPPPATRHGAASDRHGRLRGFVRTGADGGYRFDSVRPGSYPGQDVPQHLHVHVIEPGRCTYYLDDVVFTDDPLLTATARVAQDHGRGGTGIVTPTRDADGTWQARRDIVLGAGIADHDRCDRGR